MKYSEEKKQQLFEGLLKTAREFNNHEFSGKINLELKNYQ